MALATKELLEWIEHYIEEGFAIRLLIEGGQEIAATTFGVEDGVASGISNGNLNYAVRVKSIIGVVEVEKPLIRKPPPQRGD